MGNKKSAPRGSLADALVRAGVVSATQAQDQLEAKKRADDDARRAKLEQAAERGDLEAIAMMFAGSDEEESFSHAIDRGNAWFASVVANGHAKELANAKACIERIADPVSGDEVDALEKALGFSLPASYRRFLTTIGQVRFLNPWGDETVHPRDLVRETRDFALEVERLVRLRPDAGNVVYVCNYHNHSAHYLLSCAERNERSESPVHLVYHDESELYDGTYDFQRWFSEKVTRTIEEETDRLRKRQR